MLFYTQESPFMTKSVLERLTEVHSDMEIWWDSSPLVFKSWVRKMVLLVPSNKKDILESELNRIYNAKNPEKSLIRGCTTNPPLSLAAVKNDPGFWDEWILSLFKKVKGLSIKEYSFLTYKEVIKKGARMIFPIW